MDKVFTFVETYDDLVPVELQNYFEDLCFSTQIPWYFQKNISGVEESSVGGFSCGLYKSINLEKTSRELLFRFLQIPYLLCNHLKLNVLEVHTSRLFFMPPSPTPQTAYDSIHVDLDFPHYVCLYYINDSDGDTVFFEKDQKTEIKRVTPKKGRIAFFSGDIYHCTSTPSKNRFIYNTNLALENLVQEKK